MDPDGGTRPWVGTPRKSNGVRGPSNRCFLLSRRGRSRGWPAMRPGGEVMLAG